MQTNSRLPQEYLPDRPKIKKKNWWRRDIRLNVSPWEGVLRIGIGLVLPILLIWIQNDFFIWTLAIISIYLFISGSMFFCYIKYFWRKWITKKPTPEIPDPDAPVKKL